MAASKPTTRAVTLAAIIILLVIASIAQASDWEHHVEALESGPGHQSQIF